ncbi:MEDS domain-containing protein [Clostridium sp. DJ247]|uniref:MEDS domain-containing protein n=1 Tax=Clostridium sp. DJ247 TaxID=2726188 RepID=UPI00162616F4|nr:MEDS domain-containing protein [Clostridium sp. DJ247]MBC2581129.1 hypothetical protein [Clostridium sp. DJ247]
MKRVVVMMDYYKFGNHCVFYYFGIDHLMVNMYKYIKDCIERNEYIYLCAEPKLYDRVCKCLDKYTEDISYFDINRIINLHKEAGNKAVKIELRDCENNIYTQGYSGIRIIGQVSYIMKDLLPKDFLSFEENLEELIHGLKISCMCLYDFEQYIEHNTAHNNVLIKQSLSTHTHRLFKGQIEKSFK